MKIYTKTGDKGKTSLFGGRKVEKNSIRLEAYGTVDELNSVLGIAIAHGVNEKVREIVSRLQNQLFSLGSDLATPLDETKIKIEVPRTTPEMVEKLESWIDELDAELPKLKVFILPGGTKGAAYLHLARTVCRRAERNAVELAGREQINEFIVKYLNRLSDLLFVLARYENFVNNVPDVNWGNK